MENKKRFSAFFWFIIACLMVIFIYSTYRAYGIHQERLKRVVNQKIKETAMLCYFEEKCEGRVTLADLYEKMDLERQVNPITAEYMDEAMCIEYVDGEIIFC